MNVVRMVIGAAVCATLLAACGGSAEKPETPPTEQQSLDRSARLAFAQGRYDQAASLYEAALLAALKEDAPQAIVDARFNLALCQTYQGQYAEALDQLEQAEAERLRRGVVGEGSIELLRGTIHYRSGQLDKARLVRHRRGRRAGAGDRPVGTYGIAQRLAGRGRSGPGPARTGCAFASGRAKLPWDGARAGESRRRGRACATYPVGGALSATSRAQRRATPRTGNTWLAGAC